MCLYNDPLIRHDLAFRGGTALNKIFFQRAARYSEDIDLVQLYPGPIGKTMTSIRQALDGWLGAPKRKLTERGAKLIYNYSSENNVPMRLKIEINTTEHYHLLDLKELEYAVKSEWFSGNCMITTYQ